MNEETFEFGESLLSFVILNIGNGSSRRGLPAGGFGEGSVLHFLSHCASETRMIGWYKAHEVLFVYYQACGGRRLRFQNRQNHCPEN
jgi:hypothetical protein